MHPSEFKQKIAFLTLTSQREFDSGNSTKVEIFKFYSCRLSESKNLDITSSHF